MLSAQIADVMGSWARQARLPQDVAPAGVLTDEAEREVVEIVNAHLKGEFSFTNLDRAILLRKTFHEADQKQKEAQDLEANRLISLYEKIDGVLETQFPGLKRDQENFVRIQGLAKDPAFTVDAFVSDLQWHPDLWSWKDGPHQINWRDLFGRMRVSDLTAIYGEDRVNKEFAKYEATIHQIAERARPSWKVDPASKQKADTEAVAKKAQSALEADPRAIAKATAACEEIVKSFRASNNFAESGRAREVLEQVRVYTNGAFDPFATQKAREQWIRDYVPEAERRR